MSYSKSLPWAQRGDAELLYWSSELDDAVYNLTRKHRSLRQRLAGSEPPGRKWRQGTPAMAAGLIDHPWTLLDSLGAAYRQGPALTTWCDITARQVASGTNSL